MMRTRLSSGDEGCMGQLEIEIEGARRFTAGLIESLGSGCVASRLSSCPDVLNVVSGHEMLRS
jgi:hypothetical protein